MNQIQLIYFKAIAEEGGISKAAERVHVPQPYLSSQLKNIEHELGVTLAIRNTRNFQLTDAGKRFYDRAIQILELMDTTKNELETFETGLQGTLKIGTLATSAAAVLSESVRRFHEKYPHVRFEIRNMSTQSIQESLKIGLIELGFVRTPFNTSNFDSFIMPEQPMVAVQSMEFQSKRDIADLNELSQKPLLVNVRFETIITEAFQAAGFEPNISCQVDDTRLLLLWANAGMGTAIIPMDWIDIVPNLHLHHRVLSAEILRTAPAAIWLKHQTLSAAAQNFLKNFES